ncbi:hypothetical protein AXG93_2490s1230 [Marchantia polymorpha subsp. ruderalis]|uniref:CCHC-type domain-containing protein n=1 Tax=Marchantia polymorpha subsp. ruderalis TaxID=1480154 RepID=A0A176W6I3_MARPO|nr:hypothetical protein AXG93_2490s1230 [Marchantia polymorpha subsp. ruderalis]
MVVAGDGSFQLQTTDIVMGDERKVHLDHFEQLKMHPEDEIDAATDGVSSFCRIEMASKQVGGIGYNILTLDGQFNYLFWEKQSQPSGQYNLQHTGFKRQRSRSLKRRRVQFRVPSPYKRNLKNLVCLRCGKNGHIKKYCRMTIRDANLPQMANVAEHLHSEEEDVFADGL